MENTNLMTAEMIEDVMANTNNGHTTNNVGRNIGMLATGAVGALVVERFIIKPIAKKVKEVLKKRKEAVQGTVATEAEAKNENGN